MNMYLVDQVYPDDDGEDHKVWIINDPEHHPKSWSILMEIEYCPFCGKPAIEAHIVQIPRHGPGEQKSSLMNCIVYHEHHQEENYCSTVKGEQNGPERDNANSDMADAPRST